MTHPQRLDRAAALAQQLDRADVVIDPDPNGIPTAWRSLRLALLWSPPWATHRLVVQDDAIPVPGAVEKARETCEEAPSAIVALYVGRHHSLFAHGVQEALRKGRSLVEAPAGWFPTVATIYPVKHALTLAAEADSRGWGALPDDSIVGMYIRDGGVLSMLRAPSLFDHDDSIPSLLAPQRQYSRRAVALDS